MPRALKLFLAVLAALAALAAAAFSAAVWLGERKLAAAVDVRVVPVPFVKDEAARKHGRYLFESRGCAQCHGADGAGAVVVDDPGGLQVRGPNLTTGPGGVVAGYGEADWVRAIRHGVDPRGRALLFMPSEDYNRMSDPDFAALVAYVRSLPPVAGPPAALRLPLTMKALLGVGALVPAADKIDHRLPPPAPVPMAPGIKYGEYVAALCRVCHGPQLSGGSIPGAPPSWPRASNLTPGPESGMAAYDTPEKFAAMLRTGLRPDGSAVSRVMPFATLGAMNDVEVQALYAYLGTLPPRSAGRR